jgi:hypothetical protein
MPADNNDSASRDPGGRGLPRRRNSKERGKWISYGSAHHVTAQLPLVELQDVPPLVRLEAEAQARWIVMDFAQEGEVGEGVDPMRWIEVLCTLALQPAIVTTPCGLELELGRWDAVLRYIRVGLASTPRATFEGWRRKLGRDPRYALRANFLKAMRLGWGIRGESRWPEHSPWQPSRPEYFEAWHSWIGGDGPEPHPVDVVNIGEELEE